LNAGFCSGSALAAAGAFAATFSVTAVATGSAGGFIRRHDVFVGDCRPNNGSPKSSLALDSGTDEVARCAESLSVARGGGGGLVSDVKRWTSA
jgi:hypothetical protein